MAKGRGAGGRRAGRGLLGLLVGAWASLVGLAAPSHAQEPAPWWYEVMSIADAHREVTGDGVTIALFDGRIDPEAPGLAGADITIRKDCYGARAERLPATGDDHGTSMAGLLVGQDAPGSGGVVGMAPDARVLFYPQDTEESPGQGYALECTGGDTAGFNQLDDAVRAGADIVVYPIGSSGSALLQREAVQRAVDQGVVLVGSAGNRSAITLPAGLPGVVATYAVDRDAEPWEGNAYMRRHRSSPAEFPVISAPGVDIPALRYVQGSGWDKQYPSTGTSGSAPLVAGALALVKEKYPEATGNQLLQHLIHLTGGTRRYHWDRDYGFGIVSVTEMLDEDPTGWPDENPLLEGPKRAEADYPMSALGAAEQAAADSSGSPPQTDSESSDSPTASDSGSALPWVLGAGIAVLLAGTATTLALRRRPGGDTTTSVERV